MNNVFDITDFGAVGDGVTDCTKAIQQALDCAAEVKGAVVVPPGVYNTRELKIPADISFSGFSGWGYREYGGSRLSLIDKNARCLLNLTGAHGSHIKDLQLLGNQVTEGDCCGIGVFWEDYSTRDNEDAFQEINNYPEGTHEGFREDTFVIENCQVKNFPGDGIHLQHMFAFTIRGSMIMANKGHGIYLTGWDGWMVDNIIHTNGGAGIYSDDVFGSFSILQNRIEWNHRGGINVGYGGSLNINSNFFDRAYGPAIEIRGELEGNSNTITIVGNIFKRSGKEREDIKLNPYLNSHIYLNKIENSVVTSNTFRIGKDDHLKGVHSPDYAIVYKNSVDCVFENNTFQKGYLVKDMVDLDKE